MTISPFSSIGENPKWRPLFDRAEAGQPGELLTYAEIEVLTGVDVRVGNRYPVEGARRKLEELSQRTLVVERGLGYRISLPAEHLVLAQLHQRKSRRQIRKAIRKTESANRSALSREERSRLDAAELHLQRQASFLRRLDTRVKTVEQRQDRTADATAALEGRLAALEEKFKEQKGDSE